MTRYRVLVEVPLPIEYTITSRHPDDVLIDTSAAVLRQAITRAAATMGRDQLVALLDCVDARVTPIDDSEDSEPEAA